MPSDDGLSPKTACCPECGASVKPSDATCWQCRRALANEEVVVEPGSPFRTGNERPPVLRPWQFSRESLSVAITVLAICLVLIIREPALGILVTILAAPALIRRLFPGHYDRATPPPKTTGERLARDTISTVAAVAAVVASLAAGAAAFVISCYISGMVEARMLAPIMPAGTQGMVVFTLLDISALIGLVVAVLFWKLRPRRAK